MGDQPVGPGAGRHDVIGAAFLAAALLPATALAKDGTRADLRAAWKTYAADFVSADGRVMDHGDGGVTTSEGQVYGMLRAVWIGDKPRFTALRRWTRDNLQHGDETALPAWRWGRAEDASWGVLDPNSAADADQLLVYALVLGAERWGGAGLKAQALALARNVWETEVVRAGDRWVLAAGAWAVGDDVVRTNPSYFFPFVCRALAHLDPEHPWSQLLDDGYRALDESIGPAGLPPDWAWVDRATGHPVPAPAGDEALQRYGFEAVRVPWTLAAEVMWFDEPRARALLVRMDGLRGRWKADGALPAILTPDGEPAVDWSWLGGYGPLHSAWATSAPEDAQALATQVLAPARTERGWGRAEDYYAQNWIWFGLALPAGVATPARAGR